MGGSGNDESREQELLSLLSHCPTVNVRGLFSPSIRHLELPE